MSKPQTYETRGVQQNEKAEKKIVLENMRRLAAHYHQQNDTKNVSARSHGAPRVQTKIRGT